MLLNKKINVLGFDNLNNYYSLKLKKYRIKQLKKFKNFSFQKLDLKDKNKLSNYFKKNQIDIIFHLAAQAGVRYVSSHPEKFIESNIFGFHNLIEVSKLYDIKKFFMHHLVQFMEIEISFLSMKNQNLIQKNIYGLSKKINEEYILINSNKKNKIYRFEIFYSFWRVGQTRHVNLEIFKICKK